MNQKIFKFLCFSFLTLIQGLQSFPAIAAEENNALWDFGLAPTNFYLEHYPGSKAFSSFWAPIPVIEYRGAETRLDQNDGARAFLLKGESWDLDISGSLQPGQNFATDDARIGMPELPWVLDAGPQLVKIFDEHWQFRLGAFQSLATDFNSARLNGQYYDARIVFQNSQKMSFFKLQRNDYIGLSLQGASKDYMATYYDVAAQYATPNRPAYTAKEGFVCDELSFYETFRSGFSTLYVAAYIDNYDIATNRPSPLMQAHQNLSFFIGFGYTLWHSKKPSVDFEDTEGILNRLF